MNTVKLWSPKMMDRYRDKIAVLIKECQDQAPCLDLDEVCRLAESKNHVSIAKTDSRHNVIAFGALNVDTNEVEVNVATENPNYNFLDDMNMRDMVTETLNDPDTVEHWRETAITT